MINGRPDRNRLIDVRQWWDVAWTSMERAFYNCSNLNISASDIPNLAGVLSLSNMFRGCSNLNGPLNIGSWNTAAVTNMNNMFGYASSFNQPIGSWNIGAVTDMRNMFDGTWAFNQSLAPWGTKFNANVGLEGFLNNCSMSVANYDATLSGFNAGTVTGIIIGAINLRYCASAVARANLVLATGSGGKGWTFSGDGISSTCLPKIYTERIMIASNH